MVRVTVRGALFGCWAYYLVQDGRGGSGSPVHMQASIDEDVSASWCLGDTSSEDRTAKNEVQLV